MWSRTHGKVLSKRKTFLWLSTARQESCRSSDMAKNGEFGRMQRLISSAGISELQESIKRDHRFCQFRLLLYPSGVHHCGVVRDFIIDSRPRFESDFRMSYQRRAESKSWCKKMIPVTG